MSTPPHHAAWTAGCLPHTPSLLSYVCCHARAVAYRDSKFPQKNYHLDVLLRLAH